MKQYKIVVNGTAYAVEIEEISASDAASAPKAAAPAATPAKKPASGSGEPVPAPIPGNVLELSCADGATVRAGQVVLVLESMKMENEILAPCDGVITYNTQKGATVAAGDVLCTVK